MKHINCKLGLHGLGQTGQNPFQWTYLTEQCREVIECLEELIKVSRNKVPRRQGNHCLMLDRNKGMDKRSRERILEYRILQYSKIATTRPVLNGICEEIHSYQVPLRKHRASEGINDGWKAIDLLGSTADGLPVILELKCDNIGDRKGKGTNETPLRMIVEAAAYGVAIMEMWEESAFKKEWCETLKLSIEKDHLKTCQLVGIAPKEYWERAFDNPGKKGAAPEGFWREFKILSNALKDRGLPVALASVRSSNKNPVVGLDIEEPPTA